MANLKKNLIYNILYQISMLIIPLITAPYISRVIGAEGVGVYSYSTSVANYFALFMLLGVGNYGSRTIAQSKQNKELLSKNFCEIYFFQFICSVIVIIIYVLFIIFAADNNYKIALALQFIYLLSVAFDVCWYFTGSEQFKIIVTRGIIVRFAEVLLIFLLVKTRTDVYKYILIMTLGTFVSILCLWSIVFKQVLFKRVSFRSLLPHIKPNIILFIPLLATSVFNLMDKIMIKLINHDISAVGIYEYSEKIVKLPLSVILAIGTVMLPRISNLIANNEIKGADNYFKLTMKYLGILVVAMAFGIAAVAPTFSVVFYGNEFRECGKIITVLAVILITASWANIIRTQYLIPTYNEKIYTISVIAGAVVNLILNFIFIPLLGAYGAAIGTIGAEITLCVIHTVGVWKKIQIWEHIFCWIEYIVIGILMFIVVRLVGSHLADSIISLILQIGIGGLVFIISVIILLLIKKDEFLFGVLKSKK
ncbi:MAG: oligosaccharide flippase family protein [Clostridia bacterium]|nr:oligosaccharide flippase family protein [Clostridia bacterium]